MPTRQNKSDAKAQRHLSNVHAQDTSNPHTTNTTVKMYKSIVAKHEAVRRKIQNGQNIIRANTDTEAKCNLRDCIFPGECTLLE